jgi:molybdopterin-guanine dinucleotide biosynthesis protein A
VTPELLARLAAAPAVCAVGSELEPFPGHYEPAQLPVLREALAEEASLRRTLARLEPARVEVGREEIASINTPVDLAAAEVRLTGPGGATPTDASTSSAPT